MEKTAAEVLAQVEKDRGIVPGAFRQAAELDPGALAAFHGAYMHAMGESSALTEREKQLILIAVDAAVYFHYGCKFHMEEAMRAGASVDEITSALRLAGLVVGYHAPLSAYPLLRDVLDAED
ncbi:carboxymuconolactone decarboxylase family protein [Microbacterium sp. No. 7]|uniref:carboxymuconolactone decarboxylase family protein n=1 Tax=Microbacterium sp. No. 7 TaxID=1714373 RepID=UPI0006D29A6C|nr:carboxymuconolactone decarboxylase family protein [Microbacterium sp. No. 7]ALJ22104.1 hypothetical protein AOA12_20335 [Microbacterium sp. No. 7]